MNLLYYQTLLTTIIFIVLSYKQLQCSEETGEEREKREEKEIWIICLIIGVPCIVGACVATLCWIKSILKRKVAREALRERDRQNVPGHGLMPGGQMMMMPQGQMMMMPQAQGVMMYQQSGYGYQSVSPIQPIKTQDGREQQNVQQPQATPRPTALPPPPRPV